MIIQIILVIIAIYIGDRWLLKRIDKSKDSIERVLGCVLLVISNIFIPIYYIDRFNLPSIFLLNENVNTQNWLMIITTFFSSAIAASIGGLIAFGIARNQIKENNEQNGENNRIQNMPLLKYEFIEFEPEKTNDNYIHIKSECEESELNEYGLSIVIKNIGMNSIKQMILDFKSDFVSDKYRLIGDNTQNPLEKGEKQEICSVFSLNKEKEYKIQLSVFYEDVLQNWYLQTVEIKYSTRTDYKDVMKIATVKYIVNEEMKLLSKEMIEK